MPPRFHIKKLWEVHFQLPMRWHKFQLFQNNGTRNPAGVHGGLEPSPCAMNDRLVGDNNTTVEYKT